MRFKRINITFTLSYFFHLFFHFNHIIYFFTTIPIMLVWLIPNCGQTRSIQPKNIRAAVVIENVLSFLSELRSRGNRGRVYIVIQF